MWSTIKKPGCKNRDADTSRWMFGSGAPRTNLTRRGQQVIHYAQGPVPPYFSKTAARTNSVRMTVVLWYAMTLQAE